MHEGIFIWFLSLFWLAHVFGEDIWHQPNIVLQEGDWKVIPSEILYPRQKPPPPYDDQYKRNDTKIMVLIASYRETRCKDTLYNFFTKAAFPNRVFIGVVQQNEKSDPDCYVEYCKRIMENDQVVPEKELSDDEKNWRIKDCPFSDNIKMFRMNARDAKGPVYARAQQ
ncbi:hypothetical protein RFI_36668, partial [Reticulomyxa filosa]